MNEKLKKVMSTAAYLGLAVLLVLLDQFTKAETVRVLKDGPTISLIPKVLELVYVENTGAVFGFMSNSTLFFCIVTPIFVLMMGYVFFQVPKEKKFFWARLCVLLVVAGGIGNFIDRVTKGFVVDMIYFVPINFPVFNVADCYVTVGVFLLTFFLLFWKELGEKMFPEDKKKK